jgi:hypothetical protein
MKILNIFYLFIFLTISGCLGDHLPKGILSKKKMVPILVDIHLSEAVNLNKFNLSLNNDSLPEDLYLSICKKYNVDRRTIENSMVYYGKHMRDYIPVYEEVLNVLSEMELKAKNDTLRPVHLGAFDLDTTKNRKSPPPPVHTVGETK